MHDWTDEARVRFGRKKKVERRKVILMTSIRDLLAQERAAVACAKGIDAPCFVRFIVEEISVPALNTCAKILRERDDRAKPCSSRHTSD